MNFCVKVKISQNKKEKVPLFHNNQLILECCPKSVKDQKLQRLTELQ